MTMRCETVTNLRKARYSTLNVVALTFKNNGLEIRRAGDDGVEDGPGVGENVKGVVVFNEGHAIRFLDAASCDMKLDDPIERKAVEPCDWLMALAALVDRKMGAIE